jgi:methyl-accepting chemotaxis protein
MNRLKYPYKFAVIGVLALAAIAYLLVALALNLNTSIVHSRDELAGAGTIRPILRFVQLTQQHRGMSSAALGGNTAFKDKSVAKEAEIVEAIKAVDAAMAEHGAAFGVKGDWESVKREWTDLAGEWSNLTGPANLMAHAALTEHALLVLGNTADASGLVMDPDLASFYLISVSVNTLPETLERLSKILAAGVGTLSRKAVTDDERAEFVAYMAVLDKMTSDLFGGLARSAKYNESIKPTLEQFQQKFIGGVGEVMVVGQNEFSTGRISSPPEYFFDKASAAIDIGYAELSATLLPTIEGLVGKRIDRLTTQLQLSIGVAIAVLLAFAYLSIGAYLAIVGGVRGLAEGAGRIAGGDLTTRVALDTRDELASVGAGFNSMAIALNTLIGKIQASASNVTAAASSLAATSAQIHQGSQRQSESASTMAAAIEETTVGIDQIAQHAHEAHLISTESGKLSDQGSEVVHQTVAEMQQIASSVQQSAALIEQLGRQSDQISAIVNVIKEIADQTNLLALNAAIEAARAGESGRGFAVVADEVRLLAERTTKSTQDIAAMIDAIQGGTRQAVSSMQAGVARVSGGVDLAQRAGEAIEKIKLGASRVVQSVNDISLALREQSAASNEIAGNVERIAQMAEENNASVAASSDTAHELEALAAGLQEEVRRYRVN